MAISRANFWSFITELVPRNPILGIPALEDRLFANLLIFDCVLISAGGESAATCLPRHKYIYIEKDRERVCACCPSFLAVHSSHPALLSRLPSSHRSTCVFAFLENLKMFMFHYISNKTEHRSVLRGRREATHLLDE